MLPRSPDEEHRTATPLELFFDLVFVVAIAQAGSALHHSLAQGHIMQAVISYLAVFFAIWWAWMNFTWFASAYDPDDVPYRLAVFVELTGALILAAGVQRAFEQGDYTIAATGYVVMRLALVTLYLRAVRSDPERRVGSLRYVVGVSACQVGWVLLLFFQGLWWHPIVFVLLGIIELLVPAWGEQASVHRFHAGHIIERYGLFTIIVLGESILATSLGIQSAIEASEFSPDLIGIIAGGLLILFSMWWLYFDWSISDLLTSMRKVFTWGYGHLLIFASAAAVGAGLAVEIDHALQHAEVGDIISGGTVAVPVAMYLIVLWALHIQPRTSTRLQLFLLPAVSFLILLTPFSGQAPLLTGVLLIALLVVKLANRYRGNLQAAR
jgi:low temperature requirement protein LtrA